MTKTMQRFAVRLLLGVVVVIELFASAVPYFAEHHQFSSSSGHWTIVVTSESPERLPQQSKSMAAEKKMLEIAARSFILLGLIGTMALWSKIEYRWRVEDQELN